MDITFKKIIIPTYEYTHRFSQLYMVDLVYVNNYFRTHPDFSVIKEQTF